MTNKQTFQNKRDNDLSGYVYGHSYSSGSTYSTLCQLFNTTSEENRDQLFTALFNIKSLWELSDVEWMLLLTKYLSLHHTLHEIQHNTDMYADGNTPFREASQKFTTLVADIASVVGTYGVRVDTSVVQELLESHKVVLRTLIHQARDQWNVDITSRKAVQHYLFDVLCYPGINKRSLSAESLATIPNEFAAHYTYYTKVKATITALEGVLQNVKRMVSVRDGMCDILQSQYDVHSDTSGRVYSSQYPIQMLPMAVREAIVPDQGCTLIHWQYDQLDTRALFTAVHCNTPRGNQLRVELCGNNPHNVVACNVYMPSLTSLQQREMAKLMNLANLYGDEHTQLRMSVQLDVSTQVIDQCAMNYGMFMLPYMKALDDILTRELSWLLPDGFSVTMPEHEKDETLVDFKRRIRVRLAHSYGAWLVKRAWLALSTVEGVVPLVLMHDGGLVQVPTKQVEYFKQMIKEGLTTKIDGCTFDVSVGSGVNWLEASIA